MGEVDKLGWGVRLGFGAGDFAQNLVFAAVGTYLLFFCTDVVGLAPSAVATMFLVVQIADALWNPFAGVFIDRHHPSWGKYRSYLLLAGIPFALFAVFCFANPLGGAGGAWKTLYAYAAYTGFTLLFTLVNVAYGALGASLTRDTDEITTLTAVRIFLANAGCLAAMAGVPLLVAALGGADGGGTPWRMALFMGCGMLPSFVFMPLLPALRRRLGKKGLFYVFGAVAVIGMAALYALSRAGGTRSCASAWIYAAQFVKATGIIVATGYMWALVPEVIEYSETDGPARLRGDQLHRGRVRQGGDGAGKCHGGPRAFLDRLPGRTGRDVLRRVRRHPSDGSSRLAVDDGRLRGGRRRAARLFLHADEGARGDEGGGRRAGEDCRPLAGIPAERSAQMACALLRSGVRADVGRQRGGRVFHERARIADPARAGGHPLARVRNPGESPCRGGLHHRPLSGLVVSPG